MKLGERIEQIRYEKNIPVKELIGDRISKSTYSRFINNKTFLGADSFMYLVERLHMTFAMFLHLYTDFFELKYDYTILNHCLELNQVYRLGKLANKWRLKKGNLTVPEKLLVKTVEITLKDMRGAEIDDKQLNELERHYDQFNYWTDYNLKSFKATMYLLDTELVLKYARQIIKAIDKIGDDLIHEEVFYVLGRVYSRCLSEGLTDEAKEIYFNLNQMYVSQYDLGKQVYAMFYEGLANIVFLGDFDNVSTIEDAIDFFALLDMNYRVKEFYSVYDATSVHYELPELEQRIEVV